MPDSDQRLRTVNDENQDHHLQRLRRHKRHKAWQKAKDRRKNFEAGELAGFFYWTGLTTIILAASGEVANYELAWWERMLVALVGAIALLGKTYTKRRFWKQTEDAEYQEEEQNNGNS